MPAIYNDDDLFSLPKVYQAAEPRQAVMFAILFISLFAVSFPGVSKQVTFLRIPHLVFFVGKHFGTGVILSTSFCHLLPDAFESLQDPEVNRSYHGIGKWTGLIILSALLAIFLIEYISTSYVDHLHAKPSEPPSPSVSPGSFTPPKTPAQRVPAEPILIPAGPSAETALATSCTSPNCTSRSSTERTPLLQSPKVRPTSEPVRKPKRSQSLYNLNDDSLLDLILLNAPRLSRGTLPHSGLAGWGHEVACVCHMRVVPSQTHPGDVDEEEQEGREDILGMVGRQRQVVGILILQLGIMIHSFVIGLTLAIATGTDFTSLVTAIVFHQLFEGLSLGIRIAGLPSSPRPNRRWLAPTLSILFAITTPLGMGSGALAFTSARKGEAVQMRLTQGLMSGISAGMLIYAATVEMLAGDFVFGDVGGDHGHGHGHGHSGLDEVHEHDESAVQVRRKVLAVCSLLAGAAAMAFVGE